MTNFKQVKLRGFEGIWMVFVGDPGCMEIADAKAPTIAPARSKMTRADKLNGNVQHECGQVKQLQKCPHCDHPAEIRARVDVIGKERRLRVVIGCFEPDCPVGLRAAAGNVQRAALAWNAERRMG